MSTLVEAEPMARPKGRPKAGAKGKGKGTAETNQAGRITIINLKGTQGQADWLEAVHRKTRLAKSVIVRMALELWAEKGGHPPFPSSDDDQ